MRDTNICFACGLKDVLVEAGGIYHCPNPFCSGCGATYWKKENLKTEDNIIIDFQEWLMKGLETINKMPYELGNKIMCLEVTKKIVEELKNETNSLA